MNSRLARRYAKALLDLSLYAKATRGENAHDVPVSRPQAAFGHHLHLTARGAKQVRVN